MDHGSTTHLTGVNVKQHRSIKITKQLDKMSSLTDQGAAIPAESGDESKREPVINQNQPKYGKST